MRPKFESNSIAQRLNNALAQLHSCKLEHQRDKEQLITQLERAREENQKVKLKNKELKKQIRDIQLQGGRDSDNNLEAEQILSKIQSYLKRLQQSSQQLSQIAAECRIVDADIQRAASQIQRNVIKTSSGLTKYVTELIKRWGSSETMRLEHHRLQSENRQLFDLTSTLQQNFRETDKLIKELQRLQRNDDANQEIQILKKKIQTLDKENGKMKNMINTKSSTMSPKDTTQLEEKIVLFSQKIRRLEQENATIKNIHQRTMKKLEKLQEKNVQKQEKPFEGEAIQDQRKKWIEKTEQMYQEIRKLTKELMISQQSEKKVREQLSSCLQIYSRWQQERQNKKAEIEQLKGGIETYLLKLEQLQSLVSQKNNQIETLQERCEISEGEKEKIVTVYQLQVQELTDQLFKKQDVIAQLQQLLNKEHFKHEELKKQFIEANKNCTSADQKVKKSEQECQELRNLAKEKENAVKIVQSQLIDSQEQIKRIKLEHTSQIHRLNLQIERVQNQKHELAQIMQEIKDQYSSAKRQILKNQQTLQDMRQQHESLENQMRDILSCFEPSVDIWTLIAKLREKFKNFHQQLKSLREAQIRLISELQTKQSDYTLILQQTENKYLKVCQQLESANSNQQAQFKIFKMKLLQKNLCNQQILSFSKTLADLLQVLINNSSINVHQNRSSPDKKSVQDIIDLKEKLIQKNTQIQGLVKHNKLIKQELSSLSQQSLWKDKVMQQSKQQLEALEQQFQALEQQFSYLRTQKQQLEINFNGLQQKKTQLEEKMAAVSQQRDTLRQQNSQLKLQLQYMVRQLKTLQQKNALLQHQLQTTKKVYQIVDNLQAQNKELKTSAQILKKQLEQINDQKRQQEQEKIATQVLLQQNQQLKVSNANLQGQLQMALKEITDLLVESEHVSFQNAQLEQQIIELNQKIHLFEQKVAIMSKNEIKIRQDLSIKQKQANQTLQCLLKMQKQKQQLSILHNSMEKQLDQRDRQKREAQTQGIDNNYQLIKLNLEIQEKMGQIDSLQEKVEALNAQANKKDVLVQDLRNQQAILLQQKHLLQEQLQLLQEQMRTVTANNTNNDLQLDQQKERQLDDLKNQVVQLQNQLNIREKQLSRKDQIITKLLQQRDALRYNQAQLEKQLLAKNLLIQEKETELAQKGQSSIQKEEQEQFQRQNQLRKMIDDDANLPDHYQIITLQQEEDVEVNQNFNSQQQSNGSKIYLERIQQAQEKSNAIQQRHYMKIKALDQEIIEIKQRLRQQQQQNDFLKQSLYKYQEIVANSKFEYEKLSNQYQQLKQHSQLQKGQIQKSLMQKCGELQVLTFVNKDLQSKFDKLHSEIQRYKLKQKLFAEKIAQKQFENESLKTIVQTEEAKSKNIATQLEKTNKQKEIYCNRLQEIQHLMQEMHTDQGEVAKLRDICEQNQNQKQVLLDKMEELESQLKGLKEKMTSLEGRNKELDQQKATLNNKVNQSFQKIQKLGRQKLQHIQKMKQFQNYADYAQQKGYNLKDFAKIIDQLNLLTSQNSHFKHINTEYSKQINLLKDRIKQYEKKSCQLEGFISQQSIKMQSLQQQHLKSSHILKEIQRGNDQSEQLNICNEELRQQIADLKDQIQQKDNKTNQLKNKLSKQLVLAEQFQEKYNQKCKQAEQLKAQSQKYKAQMKKMSREKVLAQSQMMKYKCDLQKKQQSSKLIESQVSEEIKKNNTESSLVIKELKRQIENLKQANSVLRQQKSTFYEQKSNREERSQKYLSSQDNYTKDLPLQIGSRVSRQTSFRSQTHQKNKQYYQPQLDKNRQVLQQQNKKLKTELSRHSKEEDKLRETQKSYKILSNQLQYLKGQMKVKNISIQNLEKQYKSKVEDYSKLQRTVESLSDELNLQRKRVKNFEDLYQNIQAKRLKLSRQEE